MHSHSYKGSITVDERKKKVNHPLQIPIQRWYSRSLSELPPPLFVDRTVIVNSRGLLEEIIVSAIMSSRPRLIPTRTPSRYVLPRRRDSDKNMKETTGNDEKPEKMHHAKRSRRTAFLAAGALPEEARLFICNTTRPSNLPSCPQ